MVERNRRDGPGVWHHVINRGVARRMVFEGARDVAEFMDRIQEVTELGLLEVHSYCLVGSHYHLLARSPVGELAEAMKLVQNGYSRWFNRARKRDGPLWRGRFLSKPVESREYWDILVRYIDYNPVAARMVTMPEQYPWGSAWHYTNGDTTAQGLTRGVIEGVIADRRKSHPSSTYKSVFGKQNSKSASRLISLHGQEPVDFSSHFRNLVATAPERIQAWMQRKAKLADGEPLGIGILDPEVLIQHIGQASCQHGEWKVKPRKRAQNAWELLSCSLLQMFAGFTAAEAAKALTISPSTSARYRTDHMGMMESDALYRERASDLLQRVIASEYASLPNGNRKANHATGLPSVYSTS